MQANDYMINAKRILVTSALPYANGPLHIGHLAGAYLSADIYVRFQRMMGKDIAFICGSDENGAAITIKAIKGNTTPQKIVDQYHEEFKVAFKGIGISFDYYHRTSDPLHHETSQEFFRKLYTDGKFEERTTEQYYDAKAEQFLADRYIKGTCPKCDYDSAYGDQCENCGSTLSPTDLINPISTLTGETPVRKKTTHWYLPLNEDEEWLRDWIENGVLDGQQHHLPKSWKNHVIGQCKSWLDGGLQPRAMTRDLDWGVDVPQEIDGSEGKKLYVWMDAPIGYISATKAWAKENGKDWRDYWQDEETALLHFIGKDNIVFHCIIFPSILKAHGDYILPTNVPANQFMNLEGDKISTSRNWAIWVNDYLKDLPGREDELRYFMIKTMPEQKDSEFTWSGYQDAINNELVNNLANYVNRVVVLTNKYYEGVVPQFDENQEIFGPIGEDEFAFHDSELLRLYDDLNDVADSIRAYEFRAALTKLMDISTKGNQILQFNEPWKTIKDDEEKVKAVMNLSLQYVAAIACATHPFLPTASEKLCQLLNLPLIAEDGDFVTMMDKLAMGEHLIEAGHKINSASHLFSRIDDETIATQKAKLVPAVQEVENESPIKENIIFDDFVKIDFRTAKVVEAEKVPKADKLLKLKLDLGFEQRTVVSGIAEHYSPEEVVGREVTLVANLAPRKIRGVESQGMILMAESSNGKLSFVAPDKGWDSGMIVR